MAHAVECDFETRSRAPLKQCGIARYAEDASTEVLCLSYMFDDGPVKSWKRGEPVPADLIAHVRAGGKFVAHNLYFEIAIWNMLHKRAPHIWPPLRIEQCDCTMVRARMLALPGGLDKAGEIMNVSAQKDKAGHRLMMRLCKPNKAGQWVGDGDDFAALSRYCDDDVRAEHALEKVLPQLPPFERELWHLDHKINSRGVQIDMAAVDRLIEITEAEGARLKLKAAKVSGGVVSSPSKVAQMLAFLEAEGVNVDNLRKDTVARLLKGIIDSDAARELLEIRKMFAKASTAKLKAMRAGVCADGRLRDLLAFFGADTGRWAGRRVQTQNLPGQPEFLDVETAIAWAFEPNGADMLTAWYGSALDVVSWLLRPLIIAAPGKKLVSCDFANIEGRVLAWIAGEEWKLDAFRDYDAGDGPDLYKIAYSRSFGIPIDRIQKSQRQIGKVQELALGFGGGPGAFASMAANYGITVIGDFQPRPNEGEILTESEVENIKEGWRDAHPATAGVRLPRGGRQGGLWQNLEHAAIQAVRNPGKVFQVGPVMYRAQGDFLKCRLPCGRSLSYPFPRAEYKLNKWGKMQWVLTSWGTDSRKGGKRWCERNPYGGLLAENVTQAIARDLLAAAMPRLEARGYEIVMHVHDEIVCEVPEDFGSEKEMAAIMCDLPTWAAGIPVTAEGWQGRRYRK